MGAKWPDLEVSIPPYSTNLQSTLGVGNMNMENTQAALARTADLAVQEIPDETLVYDLRRHKAFCLNKTAAFVWRHCDGQTTISEMSRLLGNEMGAPVSEELIWYTFDKLEKAHLLEVKVTPPGGAVISRRLLAKSLGRRNIAGHSDRHFTGRAYGRPGSKRRCYHILSWPTVHVLTLRAQRLTRCASPTRAVLV